MTAGAPFPPHPGSLANARSTPAGAPGRIADWLDIDSDGRVTVYSGKVEVGQNVRTSLAQAVADELRLPLDRVRLVLADTAFTEFDAGTFGSRSTPGMAPLLRRAAAAAREVLIDLAADRWEASRDDLQVADGRVVHPETGASLGFGELAGEAPWPGRMAAPVPEGVPLLAPRDWRLAGTAAPKVGGPALVTGAHRFASDVKRPGMRVGKVLRAPAFGARLRSLDSAAAAAMPGVQVVRDAAAPDFVGVVAPDEATAERALAALRAEWDGSPSPAPPDDGAVYEYFRTHPADEPVPARFNGGVQHAAGSVAEGLRGASVTLRERYTAAYIAHAPLEPRAAVAEWNPPGQMGGVTVWTGTQRPFGVRQELAERLGLPPERVRVAVPDTGSGYGGKHYGDAAVEAALLARAVGAPVRVVWTREEECTWAYFRPAALIELTSGTDAGGRLQAWEHHTFNAGAAGIRSPYGAPHQHVEFHVTRTPLRQGSYRALAATANHFARESHLDGVAFRLGLDPLDLRRRNLQERRLVDVLEAAAGRFGWEGRPRRAHGQGDGVGYGLAVGTEKGSYVAACAEVAVERGSASSWGDIAVRRVVVAFECGAVVNPEHLSSQVEGATVQGLGGALLEAIRFAGGRVLNARFSRYRVPRFSDTPEIEVVLLDRPDLPSAGGGETPIIGVAPAVGNAVFDATGVRLRDLPLRFPAGNPAP